MSEKNRPKIIVVCGPTATGKSDKAVTIAKEINGEVISADSRQVYRGLDIGSGKITKKEMAGVPHHLLDVASPKRIFSVAQFKKLVDKNIRDIIKHGKTPIICGGTGFYIDAVVNDAQFPQVKPNLALRNKLEKMPVEELAKKLQELDSDRFSSIDTKNKVRIIRAIEIAEAIGKVPKIKKQSNYDVQWVYLDFPDEILKKRIHDRLIKRVKMGMVREVQNLKESGLSWKRLEALGLEYRYIALYLQNKIPKKQMLEELESAIWHYAKRQRTWFKKYGK